MVHSVATTSTAGRARRRAGWAHSGGAQGGGAVGAHGGGAQGGGGWAMMTGPKAAALEVTAGLLLLLAFKLLRGLDSECPVAEFVLLKHHYGSTDGLML